MGRTSHKQRTSGEGPKAAASWLFRSKREARNVLKLANILILNLKILIYICMCVYNSSLPTQERKKLHEATFLIPILIYIPTQHKSKALLCFPPSSPLTYCLFDANHSNRCGSSLLLRFAFPLESPVNTVSG